MCCPKQIENDLIDRTSCFFSLFCVNLNFVEHFYESTRRMILSNLWECQSTFQEGQVAAGASLYSSRWEVHVRFLVWFIDFVFRLDETFSHVIEKKQKDEKWKIIKGKWGENFVPRSCASFLSVSSDEFERLSHNILGNTRHADRKSRYEVAGKGRKMCFFFSNMFTQT